MSRTANKKLTKLYWPSRKRSSKRLIVLSQIAYKNVSGGWGGAPAEIEFGVFQYKN